MWHTGTVYISRRKDTKRALANEDQVEEAVRAAGGQIVYAQDLSISDQQTLFAGASIFIGPHGAGLANLVWQQRAHRLVEIFPPSTRNDCYGRLAVNLGLSYQYLEANDDGIVPIEELSELLP